MAILAAVGIVIVTVVVLGYPLFRKERESPVELYGGGYLKELFSRKESLYSTIKELDFDLKTSKLSPEDYEELSERYQGEALSLLKDIDDVEKGEDIDAVMEKEVLSRRKSPFLSGRVEKMEKLEDMEATIEKEILARRKILSVCPDCGARRREEDIFCSNCGRKLR